MQSIKRPIWILSGENTHNKHFNADMMHSLSGISAGCTGDHPDAPARIYQQWYNSYSSSYLHICGYEEILLLALKAELDEKYLQHELTHMKSPHQNSDTLPQAGTYVESHMYTQKHEHKAPYWHIKRSCCRGVLLAPHYDQFKTHDRQNTTECLSCGKAHLGLCHF